MTLGRLSVVLTAAMAVGGTRVAADPRSVIPHRP
jgi:hypothetical protein